MTSSDDRFTFEIVHVLHFRNGLNEELCCRFIFTNLQQSLDLSRCDQKFQLATDFQDSVAKAKNLVTQAPVLGAILRPDIDNYCMSLIAFNSLLSYHEVANINLVLICRIFQLIVPVKMNNILVLSSKDYDMLTRVFLNYAQSYQKLLRTT